MFLLGFRMIFGMFLDFFDDFGLSRARSLEGDASNMILTRLAKEDSKQTATTLRKTALLPQAHTALTQGSSD